MQKNKNLAMCTLASGSKGNSIFVSNKKTSILIDAGLSGIETEKRLKLNNINIEDIDAIIISHEHSDHITGAGILCRRFKIPLHITHETHKQCEHKIKNIADVRYFESGKKFKVDSLKIDTFSTSHDAIDPVGFTITEKNSKIGIATDLGIATALVKESLKNSNLLLIEANYDKQMLEDGPYEWHLKQRIKHRNGHLSNCDTKKLIEEIMHPKLDFILLGHLSEENNHPQKAYEEAEKALNGNDFNITLKVTNQHSPSKIFYV